MKALDFNSYNQVFIGVYGISNIVYMLKACREAKMITTEQSKYDNAARKEEGEGEGVGGGRKDRQAGRIFCNVEGSREGRERRWL